jgi:hypothetical protein
MEFFYKLLNHKKRQNMIWETKNHEGQIASKFF